jgi:hypothetical protein
LLGSRFRWHLQARLIVAAIILGSPVAEAQQPATLTLACKGTTYSPPIDEKPQAISMGLIVNLTTGTVQGFGTPGLLDYPVRITAANDVTIVFGGSQAIGNSLSGVLGTIDRVTGDVEATSTLSDSKTSHVVSQTYALQCKPTQRMF